MWVWLVVAREEGLCMDSAVGCGRCRHTHTRNVHGSLHRERCLVGVMSGLGVSLGRGVWCQKCVPGQLRGVWCQRCVPGQGCVVSQVCPWAAQGCVVSQVCPWAGGCGVRGVSLGRGIFTCVTKIIVALNLFEQRSSSVPHLTKSPPDKYCVRHCHILKHAQYWYCKYSAQF